MSIDATARSGGRDAATTSFDLSRAYPLDAASLVTMTGAAMTRFLSTFCATIFVVLVFMFALSGVLDWVLARLG